MLRLMAAPAMPTQGVDWGAEEAKENDRALSGEAPMREGLAVGTTALLVVVVVLRYHGLSELRWETVKENRDDAQLPTLAAAGSNRKEAVRRSDVKDPSSSESSKSSDDTTAVTADSSTNGRTP